MSENKIKRFALMAGSIYYPNGGFEDYIGSYDKLEEADARLNEWKKDECLYWARITDLNTMETIKEESDK